MLKGLVGFVTGGASGLGRSTVERFVREGARVVVCDLPGAEVKRDDDLYKKNTLFVPCDVTSESDVQNAFGMCEEKYGNLDVLVNCAGIHIGKRILNSKKDKLHSLKDFQKVQEVNVLGNFNTIRYASLLFIKNQMDEDGQRGVIINTASIAAFEGQIGQTAYSASKGAIVGMTLPIARDLASYGIRNVTIAPGVFDTPLMKNLPEKYVETLKTNIPFPRRFGKPDEFAQLVQTIVLNKFLNGETIRLDGGLRMQP